MIGKRRLLAAVTALGYVHTRRALQGSFDLVPAFSELQAVTAIRNGDVDAVLCSIHFDDSRMFDLLRKAREIIPEMDIVCCRILHSELDPVVLNGVESSCQMLGALGFVDYNSLHRQFGVAEADRRFLEALLRLLPSSSSESKFA